MKLKVGRIMEAEKKKLAAVKMNAVRRSCSLLRIKRMRSKRIKEMMKVKRTIIDDIQKKQLLWYGHVKRMSEKRLPKIIFNYKKQSKKTRGRPRKVISKNQYDRDIWKMNGLFIENNRRIPRDTTSDTRNRK